jgi:hypothetical protein
MKRKTFLFLTLLVGLYFTSYCRSIDRIAYKFGNTFPNIQTSVRYESSFFDTLLIRNYNNNPGFINCFQLSLFERKYFSFNPEIGLLQYKSSLKIYPGGQAPIQGLLNFDYLYVNLQVSGKYRIGCIEPYGSFGTQYNFTLKQKTSFDQSYKGSSFIFGFNFSWV